MTWPLVVKIGGAGLGEAGAALRAIAAQAAAGDVPVVVHGGGNEATRWLERMGVATRFEGGLRVTDEEALPVVVAVYAGLVNKRLVAALNAAGARAFGLSGADARVIRCRLAAGQLGFVGEPVAVDPAPLLVLRGAGIVPVVAPIGCIPGEPEDQLVNVNADTVAAEVAAALQAREIVFLTDVEGVSGPDGAVISKLTAEQARALVASGVATGGMVPKLQAALRAVTLGVPARIGLVSDPGLLGDPRRGTRLIPERS